MFSVTMFNTPDDHRRMVLACVGRLAIFRRRRFRDGTTESDEAFAARSAQAVASYLIAAAAPGQVISLHAFLRTCGMVGDKSTRYYIFEPPQPPKVIALM